MEEPQLLEVSPTSLTYSPPFGERKKIYLEMKNLSDKPIGCKILSNRPTYYVVRPNGIVIKPKASAKVIFRLRKVYTDNILKVDAWDHAFHIFANIWPNADKKFDHDLWKILEKGPRLQMVKVVVTFTGAPSRPPTAKPADAEQSTRSVVDADKEAEVNKFYQNLQDRSSSERLGPPDLHSDRSEVE